MKRLIFFWVKNRQLGKKNEWKVVDFEIKRGANCFPFFTQWLIKEDMCLIF